MLDNDIIEPPGGGRRPASRCRCNLEIYSGLFLCRGRRSPRYHGGHLSGDAWPRGLVNLVVGLVRNLPTFAVELPH